MKNAALIFLAATIALTVSSCFHNNHDIRISVKETSGLYHFTASFPENKTGKIQDLINKEISPASIFSSRNDNVDLSTILPDKTHFSIKASPGELSVNLDRHENTRASYLRVKKMCEEIKYRLAE